MPAPLRSRFLAALGLALVAMLCVQLLRGSITLPTAATRAVALVVVLVLVDRVVVPIGRLLIGDPRPDGEETDPGEGAGSGAAPTMVDEGGR